MTSQLSFPQLRDSLWNHLGFPEESDRCPAEVRCPPQFFSKEEHVWPQRSPPVVAVAAEDRRGSQEGLCLASTPESDHTTLHLGQVLRSAHLGTYGSRGRRSMVSLCSRVPGLEIQRQGQHGPGGAPAVLELCDPCPDARRPSSRHGREGARACARFGCVSARGARL